MKTCPEIDLNQLFAAFPQEARECLRPFCELIPLEKGMSLCGKDAPSRYVYFPIDAIVALLYIVDSGSTSEFSIVGNEGLVGIFSLLSGENHYSQATVISAGYGYRLPRSLMQEQLAKNNLTLSLFFRYLQTLMIQMAQTAVCNRHHSVEQQLCRFLLMSLDRLPCDNLTITQEMISNMLGVRREGITEAAGNLQRIGAINYSRGHIRIVDRRKLEGLSCECYSVVKKEAIRLFPALKQDHLGDLSQKRINFQATSRCELCFKHDECTYSNKSFIDKSYLYKVSNEANISNING